jgi:predicted RNA-binding Zn ribbon-like protein
MPLLLVQAFVNTLDFEDGVDMLEDAEGAGKWFVDAALLNRRAKLTRAGAERARIVRESIRDLIGRGGGDIAPLREVAAARSPRLVVGDRGNLSLENPRHEDVKDALFELLLIVRAAQEDGTWERLRVCANPDCRWAFYDRSRNQQGNWCDMAVCGNRLKNRDFRARLRG